MIAGGFTLLIGAIGISIALATVYLVLARLLYWGCVFVAIVWRCSQTPSEAKGLPDWQTQAEEWYSKILLLP